MWIKEHSGQKLGEQVGKKRETANFKRTEKNQ
jgi:hypothetical protein